VAVQLPAATTPDVPAPQMGEEGKPVEITYWSAIFQATVNGRKDDIQAFATLEIWLPSLRNPKSEVDSRRAGQRDLG